MHPFVSSKKCQYKHQSQVIVVSLRRTATKNRWLWSVWEGRQPRTGDWGQSEKGDNQEQMTVVSLRRAAAKNRTQPCLRGIATIHWRQSVKIISFRGDCVDGKLIKEHKVTQGVVQEHLALTIGSRYDIWSEPTNPTPKCGQMCDPSLNPRISGWSEITQLIQASGVDA